MPAGGLLLLEDLPIQFFQLRPNQFQCLGAKFGKPVLFSAVAVRGSGPDGYKPTVALHSAQQRIKCTRANIIAMPPELSNHPLAIHSAFRRMVQDVDFPEAQQNFSNQL